MCREPEDLVRLFRTLATDPRARSASPCATPSRPWIYHDERPYSERLAALLGELAERHSLGDGVVLRPPTSVSA